jgi:hypothetical protein
MLQNPHLQGRDTDKRSNITVNHKYEKFGNLECVGSLAEFCIMGVE